MLLPDATLALLRRPYDTLPALRRRDGGAAEVRLLGERALVVGGADGVRLFYDDTRMRRAGAVPKPLQRTLFGDGPVHVLDDELHRQRKAMFVRSVADPAAVTALAQTADEEWLRAAVRWVGAPRVVLFDEAVAALTDAVCRWAGVPLTPGEAPRRARDLAAVVDGFGSVGVEHVRARRARRRLEHWAGDVVRAVRSGQLRPAEGSVLAAVTTHRDAGGGLLDDRTAAVELLNVLRPTVAVAWFVVAGAVALHEHPAWRAPAAQGDPATLEALAHEVRRTHPFVPALAARARARFTWQGRTVHAGQLVVLDVEGTDHDPDRFPNPESFDPGRWLDAAGRFVGPDPFSYVPQGGGDVSAGHRCPGERATIALIAGALRVLAALSYDLSEQDLRVDRSRLPTRPASGVALTDVGVDLRETAPHQHPVVLP
ncbi:MAG: cytochrome P450 [Motilibacteraceae bacterium]